MDFYTFGLSLDPHAVHQRHVLYDDSDEETDTESMSIDPQLRVIPEWASSNVRLLLCAVGDAAAIFARTHILSPVSVPTAHVISGQSDEVFERTYQTQLDDKQQVSELYIQKDMAVCLHVKTLKQQFAMSWARTVMSAVKPKEVIILTTTDIYQYITADPSAIALPHIRCLRTSQVNRAVEVPLLESPNFISGEAAAMITHCEVHALPGYLQVHYSKKLEMSTVQSFKKTPLQAFGVEVQQAAEESIRKLLPKETASMLYT